MLIVGGGFGGLYCAKGLAGADVDVTIVDRRNHHLFQPLLYQVASGALDPSDIASPLRQIFAHDPNVTVLLGEADAIDPARRVVRIDGVDREYDALVLATGVSHTYFGHDEYAPLAPGLKTLDDALEIRRRVFAAFERAEQAALAGDREAVDRLLTFVVVGGGATGVELAGALAEIATETLPGEFRAIEPGRAQILLVEAHPRLLPGYPERLQRSAEDQLQGLGVTLRLGTRLEGIDELSCTLSGARVPTETVLWAAGVAASPLGRALGAPLDRSGRVLVEPDLSVPGRPEVFVVGDLAAITTDGRPVPGVAQGAIQGGRVAAENVLRRFHDEDTVAFRYRDKGALATIGRARAVADLGRVTFRGPLAWLVWAVVHIFFLIGYRNRASVMLSWAWAWITGNRQARLITGAVRRRATTPR